jgi:cobalt-zinc-cadmium efflux system membrane fusion protein
VIVRPTALVALAGALLVAGCGGAPAAEAPAAPAGPHRDTALVSARTLALAEFGFDTVRVEPWRGAIALPARVVLDPQLAQPIGSIVEGRVVRVHVQPGDAVRAGQVLVTLHSHEMLDARNQLGRARAMLADATVQVEAAGAALARTERLLTLKAASQAELERARAAKAAADAMRAAAASDEVRAHELVTHLFGAEPDAARGADPHHVYIRAQRAGVVMARSVGTEQVVAIGTPLLVIGPPQGLLLRVDVPESALAAAVPGAPVSFTVPSHPGRRFTATVVRVTPMLDSLSRTSEVLARIGDGLALLHAEQGAQAELLGPVDGEAPVVPLEAVQRFEGDTVVITASQRGEGMFLEAVRVRVRRTSTTRAALTGGVAPGTVVVTRGAALAKAELLKQQGGGEGEP